MKVSFTRPIRAGVVVLVLAIVGPLSAAEVTLDNGVIGDGHLSVTVDDFGSFADAFQGGPQWVDFFDPSADPVQGEFGEEYATFSANLYLFIDDSGTGIGTHRVALSDHAGINTTYPNPSFTCSVTSENSMNNLPTSTSSAFQCTGAGGFTLNLTLTQSVSALPQGKNGEALGQLEQTYTVTNAGADVRLTMTKHIDEDMPWGTPPAGSNFAQDDLVGADFAALGRPQVYAQDGDLTTAALVLRTREDMTKNPLTVPGGFSYYVGKQNLPTPPGNPNFPGGACPAHAFGTDLQIWDGFGVPNCWKDFVPGVGYNVPGISPQTSGDSFMGLQVAAQLGAGQSYEVTFSTLYGFRPPPTLQIPPSLEFTTVSYDEMTGCADFLWSIRNVNPIVPGKDPIAISEFYIDVEAGDGAQNCSTMTPPPGWTVELCDGYTNGHALYRFSGGPALGLNEKVVGRFEIDTNGMDQATNPQTNITVPPMAIVLHAAQGQVDAQCSFVFGPAFSGEWGLRLVAIAFLPVPTMSAWAKIMLAVLVLAGGTILIRRGRRNATA